MKIKFNCDARLASLLGDVGVLPGHGHAITPAPSPSRDGTGERPLYIGIGEGYPKVEGNGVLPLPCLYRSTNDGCYSALISPCGERSVMS